MNGVYAPAASRRLTRTELVDAWLPTRPNHLTTLAFCPRRTPRATCTADFTPDPRASVRYLLSQPTHPLRSRAGGTTD
eukprot:5821581-Pleurochrysis_carterae.AAC.1